MLVLSFHFIRLSTYPELIIDARCCDVPCGTFSVVIVVIGHMLSRVRVCTPVE